MQGHFTELLKSHRQKRNEVQPENEVSVTPVSVQTAMSSSGSGRKEVTACWSRTVLINVVTLHRARLVHGWVTILGQITTLVQTKVPRSIQPGRSLRR